MTDEQISQLKEFFGPSVDFSKVKIRESPFASGNRPWACGNVIRVKKTKPGQTLAVDTADLIHECGHVWQHQNGQLVFLSALAEQLRAGIVRKFDPYNFGGPTGAATLRKLSSFFDGKPGPDHRRVLEIPTRFCSGPPSDFFFAGLCSEPFSVDPRSTDWIGGARKSHDRESD